jgi:hypothetical protein
MSSLTPPVPFITQTMSSTNQWVEVAAIPSNISFGTLQLSALETSGAEATLEVAIANDLASISTVKHTDYAQVKARGNYAGFGRLVKGGERVFVRASHGSMAVRAAVLCHEIPSI